MAPAFKRRSIQVRRDAKRHTFSRVKNIDEEEQTSDDDVTPEVNAQDDILPEPSDYDSSSDDDGNGRQNEGASYSSLLKSLDVGLLPEPVRKRQKTTHSPLSSDAGYKNGEYEEGDKRDKDNASKINGTATNGETISKRVEVIDSDDEEDTTDPFVNHFEDPDESLLAKKIKAVKDQAWKMQQIQPNQIGKMSYSLPLLDAAQEPYTFQPMEGTKEMKLKKRFAEAAARSMPELTGIQATLAPGLFSYNDILFGGRNPNNAASLRTVTCLHILNHVFKTRDRLLKNSARLARNKDNPNLELRDQGFTRPKILLLLETRESCVRYMDTITELCAPDQIENKKRFQDAFVAEKGNFSEDKPPDFVELFDGNDDNDFRLGIKFTRKTLKYYSQFYNSDIILASPLGLRRAMKVHDPKNEDRDFLSSIEIVVVDQADAMLMQNWEHVEFAFSQLNLQPKESHGCDFSRVRQWYLDQNAKYLRQTIVFSAYLTPEINALFSTHMLNVAGKIKAVPSYPGAIINLPPTLQIRQLFSRIHCADPAKDPDTRFKYFSTAVLPSISRHRGSGAKSSGLGILIFIPSYFDYLRIRNYFSNAQEASHLSFGNVSEYDDPSAVRRARSHFLSGRHDILLYTGRSHHFRRYRIRGVKQVVMYSVPENPRFYEEVVGGYLGQSVDEGTVEQGAASIRVLFSKWDGLALERVVGSERVARMLREGAGDTFEFR